MKFLTPMRSFLLILLLGHLTGYLYAQKIDGIVYDKINHEPVPGAHVYFDGSSLYDVTNAEGKFEIKINSYINLPLVISHVSYQTTSVSNPFTSLPDTIYVTEKENLLSEVVVQAGRYSRKQLVNVFRKEFLGETQSASSCIIENEDKIEIWYDDRTNTLSAKCDEPVLIQNHFLGYTIKLILDKFEVTYPSRSLGAGTPILVRIESSTFFDDIASSNKIITKRREQVFEGSASHFLRALSKDTLESLNTPLFTVPAFRSSGIFSQRNIYSTIRRPPELQQDLLGKLGYILLIKGDRWAKKTDECFTVTHLNGLTEVVVDPLLKPKNFSSYHGIMYYGKIQVQRANKEETEVYFLKDTFFIDSWGNPSNDILFVGYMGSLRIGDRLPANYGMETSVPIENFAWNLNSNITIEDRLRRFWEIFPTEKIYIHQDRIRYAAGETVWFKAYRNFSKKNDTGSGILYVDLINGMNQLVSTSQWPIDNNMAAGHINLPDTLSSGNYQLRAYTRWMQNPGMVNYFTQEIHVFSSQDQVIAKKSPPPLSPFYELHLFPEGGNLVEGMPSKIAFKVTDHQGKGLDATGIIKDREGKEVQRFQTEHNGMGVFSFIPEPENQYSAHLDNYPVKKKLPKAYTEGLTMELKHNNNWIHVTVKNKMDIDQNQSTFYMTIHQKGVDYYTTFIDNKQSSTVLNIPLDYLPEGIFTITIYDKNLHAWCERLAFIKYPKPLLLHVTSDQQTFKRREKVTVQIKASDQYGFPQSGNFSLAVIHAALDEVNNRNNFYSDFFLQSELKGIIENPASYFDVMDNKNLENLDLLMLTHGWRTYSWDDIMSTVMPKIRYPIETNLYFSGKVEPGKRQTKGKVNVTAILSQDSLREVTFGHPEDNGSFLFEGYHFHDTIEVILSAADDRNATLNLSIDKPAFPAPDYFCSHYIIINDSLKVDISNRIPIIWNDMENTTFELPEVSVTAFRIRRNINQNHYSANALTIYKVDNDFSYISSGSKGAMAILDYIPQMYRLKQGGRTFYAVLTPNSDGSVESLTLQGEAIEPFYLIDGIRVDRKVIESTPVSRIASVELLTGPSAMIYGSGAFAGAIIFHTRDWNETTSLRQTKTVIYKFPGYNQEKQFYSPDYSLPQTNFRPDYRNTLYWQPNIIIDKNGQVECSFYTSDESGEYIIDCQGISTMNEIGVSQSSFKVF